MSDDILICSESEFKSILKLHNVTESEFQEMIDIVASWLQQTNLPLEGPTKVKVKVFLLNSKLNIEKTKRSLEGYYIAKSHYSNFFDKMVPGTNEYKDGLKYSKFAVLPKLTPDLCRLTIFKTQDPQALLSDGLLYQMLIIMGVELRIFKGDQFFSNILIIDLEDCGWKNLFKYNPTVCNTLVNLLLKLNIRLKYIHFINLNPVMDKIWILIKLLLPSKMLPKVITHQNHQTLYKYVPKEYLPSNYGGTQPSIEEIQEKWVKEIEKNEQYYQNLVHLKWPENMEIKMWNNEQFGLEGSFRNLSVD